MRPETRLKILEFLEGSAELVEDLLSVFTMPYRTSYSRMDYLLQKRHEEADRIVSKRTRRSFHNFLYRLKKDGLITKMDRNKKTFFKLSPRGKEILQKLRSVILPSAKHENKEENTLKIVIFDIPEKEKNKRDWLRSALKNLDFNMIQKSVWMGKSKLPEEFIRDLGQLNILSYVEIFAITKAGSLRSLKGEY